MRRRLALFVDRAEAGRRLAPALERFRAEQPVDVDFGQVSDEEVQELLAADREPDRVPAGADPPPSDPPPRERAVEIEPATGVVVAGDLRLPDAAAGLVVFAHRRTSPLFF